MTTTFSLVSQFDTLPIELTEAEMQPGDLVFISGTYFNTKVGWLAFPQAYSIAAKDSTRKGYSIAAKESTRKGKAFSNGIADKY